MEQLRNPIAEVELQQHQQAPRPRMVVTVIPKLLVDGEKLTSGHAVLLLLSPHFFRKDCVMQSVSRICLMSQMYNRHCIPELKSAVFSSSKDVGRNMTSRG